MADVNILRESCDLLSKQVSKRLFEAFFRSVDNIRRKRVHRSAAEYNVGFLRMSKFKKIKLERKNVPCCELVQSGSNNTLALTPWVYHG
jgi:hypothetical protein